MNRIKLLLVENDPDMRQSLAKHVLEPEGFEVLQADSPAAARDVLAHHLIHVAIVDVRLEQESDGNDRSGLELCAEMDPAIARIIVTGFADWKLVRSALRPGDLGRPLADGFLAKDEDGFQTELLKEVRRLLKTEFEVIPTARYAILTSGGDSPGMNAAIWGSVRAALQHHIEVFGVQDGYRGLVEGRLRRLRWNEVTNIPAQSATILGTARLPEFKDKGEVRAQAAETIAAKHISGLIVIGGDGSMNGARALAEDLARDGKVLQTVALPGTVDNDLWGTDLSLGAMTTADAMTDSFRQMAASAHAFRRILVGRVMGACSGYLALQTALGIGADAVLIPERVVEVEPVTGPNDRRHWRERVLRNKTKERLDQELASAAELLKQSFAFGKRAGFVIFAEGITKAAGDRLNEDYVVEYLQDEVKRWPIAYRPDVRPQELGYPPRGAAPCAFDVWLGASLGAAAVQSLVAGRTEMMLGWSQEKGIIETPFAEVAEKSARSPQEVWQDRPKWRDLWELQQMLACAPGSYCNTSAVNGTLI